jgi:uncharacterized protein (DUF58 family)
MSKAEEKLAAYMDRIAQVNPDGRKFVTVPWKDMSQSDRMRLPFYLRSEFPIAEVLIFAGWLMVFIGFLSPFGVTMAFGIALLVSMHLSSRQVWKATGAWDVSQVDFPKIVTEKEDFVVNAVLKNNSPTAPLFNAIVSIRFAGGLREFGCQMVDMIPPGEAVNVRFNFKADRGMGSWPVSEFTVTLRDALGLRFLSLEHPWRGEIQVNPEHIPLSRFEIERAGLSLHSGDYEVKAPGFSTSFLGMREFRQGDSMTHIDWKRSMRTGTILVKEFERMCATDATLFIDVAAFGHGEFGGTSTVEAMKDSALSVIRCLISQQVQVQIISADTHIPFGKSQNHIEYMTHYIRDLKPSGNTSFSQVVVSNLHHIPADSVVIMLFSTANTELKGLLQSFVVLDDRRVETSLAVINTDSFFAKIRKDAKLDKDQNMMVEYVINQIEGHTQSGEVKRILEKVLSHTYMIEPGATLADVYNLKHGH